MNASSESGLWALTITRGSTDVIRNGMTLHPVYTTASDCPSQNREKPCDKKEKGGHPTACEPGNFVRDHPNCASRAGPASCRGHCGIRSLKLSVLSVDRKSTRLNSSHRCIS